MGGRLTGDELSSVAKEDTTTTTSPSKTEGTFFSTSFLNLTSILSSSDSQIIRASWKLRMLQEIALVSGIDFCELIIVEWSCNKGRIRTNTLLILRAGGRSVVDKPGRIFPRPGRIFPRPLMLLLLSDLSFL